MQNIYITYLHTFIGQVTYIFSSLSAKFRILIFTIFTPRAIISHSFIVSKIYIAYLGDVQTCINLDMLMVCE